MYKNSMASMIIILNEAKALQDFSISLEVPFSFAAKNLKTEEKAWKIR